MADSSEHHTMPSMPTPRIITACSPSLPTSNSAGLLLLFACLLSVASLTGCVERTVSVTSEPSGALVFLNDEEVGRTPVTVPFTFYGVYQVRLQRDGYHGLSTSQKAVAPWWEAPGPDLFAEMIPNNRVKLAWHYELEKAEAGDPDRIIDHASQLRSLLQTESPALDTQVVEPTQAAPEITSEQAR